MANPNHDDTERASTIADLIHDEIGDRLHHDHGLVGPLENVSVSAPNQVRFTFTDGRRVTVHVEIDEVT